MKRWLVLGTVLSALTVSSAFAAPPAALPAGAPQAAKDKFAAAQQKAAAAKAAAKAKADAAKAAAAAKAQ